MRIFAEALWMPKAGNTQSEYEDAFWPRHSIHGEKYSRFAVADGATETSFSGIWATQLVRAYCAGEFDHREQSDQFSKLQRKWWSIVRRKPLPWYAEEKLEKGTFAALVGITLQSDSETAQQGTWHALAIGDSCLFQLRGGSLLSAFPIQNSADFTNSPVLLSTKSSNNPRSAFMETDGKWEAGDHFYLMSDAIAAWFLREFERQESPWEIVRDWDTEKQPFRSWVESARNQNLIRNDDVTVYRIEIS